MQRDLLLLTEMIDATEQAQRLVDGVTVSQLEADRQRRDALLWNFTVLGEAAGQVSEDVATGFISTCYAVVQRSIAGSAAAPWRGAGATTRLERYFPGEAAVTGADRRCCGQVLVHRSDCYRAFASGGGDALDRAVAYVARGEHAWQVCLEGKRCPGQRPGSWGEVSPGEDETMIVKGESVADPGGVAVAGDAVSQSAPSSSDQHQVPADGKTMITGHCLIIRMCSAPQTGRESMLSAQSGTVRRVDTQRRLRYVIVGGSDVVLDRRLGADTDGFPAMAGVPG
jgi:hypothetical protein